MAVEYKTLTFPNNAEGQAEKIRSLQWYSSEGWEVISENITQGKFRGGTAFCLAVLICLPAAFCAGSTDGEITVTLKRDSSRLSSRDTAREVITVVATPVASQSTASVPVAQLPSSSRKIYEPVVGVETDALIKRAFLFLEDGEKYNAERYIEQALNQDPENPQVYMAKLMLEHRVQSPVELLNKLNTLLEEEKLFQRALRFAVGEYKSQLEGLAQSNRNKLEQERMRREKEEAEERVHQNGLMLEKKEKYYQEAILDWQKAKTPDEIQTVINRLEKLKGYKDVDELLSDAREKLTEAEKEEKRKHKKKIIAVIVSILIFGGMFWYSAKQEGQRIQQEAEARREAQQKAETQIQAYASDYAKGEEYLNAKNYSPAFEIFKRLANDGYAPAQDKLAWMYQNGWGVEQDYSQAVSWFRKAAEQGNTEAMASMGLMYYRGWGVSQNYDTSLEWYGRAAAQGSEVAQRRINSIQLLKANKAKIAEIERGTGFPTSGTIFAETLSVRESPNTKSKRVKTLKTGHPVSISRATESDNDYWFYVKTASGTEGWVLGGYVNLIDRDLSYQETTNKKHSLPASGYVTTREDSLNLRNIPTVKGSQVVEKLDSGTYFTAYEVFAGDTIDWYRIRTTEGDEGWVSGKYIELY